MHALSIETCQLQESEIIAEKSIFILQIYHLKFFDISKSLMWKKISRNTETDINAEIVKIKNDKIIPHKVHSRENRRKWNIKTGRLLRL